MSHLNRSDQEMFLKPSVYIPKKRSNSVSGDPPLARQQGVLAPNLAAPNAKSQSADLQPFVTAANDGIAPLKKEDFNDMAISLHTGESDFSKPGSSAHGQHQQRRGFVNGTMLHSAAGGRNLVDISNAKDDRNALRRKSQNRTGPAEDSDSDMSDFSEYSKVSAVPQALQFARENSQKLKRKPELGSRRGRTEDTQRQPPVSNFSTRLERRGDPSIELRRLPTASTIATCRLEGTTAINSLSQTMPGAGTQRRPHYHPQTLALLDPDGVQAHQGMVADEASSQAPLPSFKSMTEKSEDSNIAQAYPERETSLINLHGPSPFFQSRSRSATPQRSSHAPPIQGANPPNDFVEFPGWPIPNYLRRLSRGPDHHLSTIRQSPEIRNSELTTSKRRSLVNELNRSSLTPSYMFDSLPVSTLPRVLGQSSFKQSPRLPLHQTASIENVSHPREIPVAERDSNGNPITTPPDGGRLAWLMACCGFLVIFNAWGISTAFGVFQTYYAIVAFPELSYSRIAWIGSMQLFLLFFLGIPAGALMSRGYFRVAFNGGTVLLLIGCFLTAFCREWWQLLLAQGVCTGLGMGFIFCSGVMVLMQYFSTNIGVAMALAASGGPVGSIIYAITFQQLILSYTFKTTTLIMAGIATFTMLIPTAIVRPRRGHPEQKRSFSTRACWDIPYLFMSLGLFFAFWGLYFGFYYIILFAVDSLHMSGTDSITLLVAMCAANIPGRLLPGLISDRCIGPLNTTLPSCALAAIMIFLWIGDTTRSGLYMIACFYGFFAAGIQSMYSPTIYSFCYQNPKLMSQKTGVSLTIISFACLTGQPIGGRLIEAANGSFRPAQLFAGGSLMAAFVCLGVARVLKVGWKPLRA